MRQFPKTGIKQRSGSSAPLKAPNPALGSRANRKQPVYVFSNVCRTRATKDTSSADQAPTTVVVTATIADVTISQQDQ